MPEPSEPEPWWRRAVFYQIYPRSFADSGGDGVGDLEGIRRHLDHLTWLGVDALWISPIYRSPMADFGYDIADHCAVDPLFGDLDALDRLVTDAHERGLRVVLDWVANHTSDRHPWFEASRSSVDDPHRDWYVWRDGRDGAPPNNWRASFTGEVIWPRDADGQLRPILGLEPRPEADASAWRREPRSGQWYLHSFLPEQPDLNWRNPEVVRAMHAVLRFWLDRGVDGFRADALAAVAKPADLADLPEAWAAVPGSDLHDDPVVHDMLRGVRAVLDDYPGDRVLIGEVHYPDLARVLAYYGGPEGRELDLAFDFPPMLDAWRADRWRAHIDETAARFDPVDAWPAWVLSNHDFPRHADRFGSDARARAAAVLLLTLRGTPFVYQGEELGLVDAEVPAADRLDPGGRDGCRAPLPWTAAPDHGWPGSRPWLPFAANVDGHDVASERRDPRSVLHLYRALLTARRASPALQTGRFRWIDAPEPVLAYRREAPGDERLVAVNTGSQAVAVAAPGDWIVEVSADRVGEGARYDGTLGPDGAVVLRPA